MPQTAIDEIVLRLISQVSLFKNLEREDLIGMLRNVSKATFTPGEIVFEEGFEGHSMYVVVQGYFEVYRQVKGLTVPFAKIGPCAHFGEIALISSRPRTASVRSVGDGIALRLNKQAIFSEPHAAAIFFRNMSRLMAERLVCANEEIILHKAEQADSDNTHAADLPGVSDKLRSASESIYKDSAGQ
jgi:CRP-like cAMP-binding protein